LSCSEGECLTSKDDAEKRQLPVLRRQSPLRLLRQEVLGEEVDKSGIEEKTR
jgi:hypothetical protein